MLVKYIHHRNYVNFKILYQLTQPSEHTIRKCVMTVKSLWFRSLAKCAIALPVKKGVSARGVSIKADESKVPSGMLGSSPL